mmetsp:Transcript_23060/g.39904  ORF Transcript_23060/g.39904 Transcript_23060/m.39904 type:complete len:124 (-) Transcript_23060:397-768(-)
MTTATINWKLAMEQVGEDEEFLNEVLQDLLTEAQTSEEEIAEGIVAQNFEGISKAAHRIKGSASYLHCENLRIVSFELQDLGHNVHTGKDVNPSAAMSQIKTLFERYKKLHQELKDEVTSHKK